MNWHYVSAIGIAVLIALFWPRRAVHDHEDKNWSKKRFDDSRYDQF